MDMNDLVNAVNFINRYNGGSDGVRFNGSYMSSSEYEKCKKVIKLAENQLNNGDVQITPKTKVLTEILRSFLIIASKTGIYPSDVKIMNHLALAVNFMSKTQVAN